MSDAADLRTVRIPACADHAGMLAWRITVPWVCIHCGEPRGEPVEGTVRDGAKQLEVHTWENACGHIEAYSEIRDALVKTALRKIGHW